MAFNIAKAAVVGQAREVVSGVTSLAGSGQGGINWQNYNFPPCINLVHFSLDELQGTLRRFVLCQYLNFIIIIFIQLFNRIS